MESSDVLVIGNCIKAVTLRLALHIPRDILEVPFHITRTTYFRTLGSMKFFVDERLRAHTIRNGHFSFGMICLLLHQYFKVGI